MTKSFSNCPWNCGISSSCSIGIIHDEESSVEWTIGFSINQDEKPIAFVDTWDFQRRNRASLLVDFGFLDIHRTSIKFNSRLWRVWWIAFVSRNWDVRQNDLFKRLWMRDYIDRISRKSGFDEKSIEMNRFEGFVFQDLFNWTSITFSLFPISRLASWRDLNSGQKRNSLDWLDRQLRGLQF